METASSIGPQQYSTLLDPGLIKSRIPGIARIEFSNHEKFLNIVPRVVESEKNAS